MIERMKKMLEPERLSPKERNRREEEAHSIFTAENSSEDDLRRALDLMMSTIPHLPDWPDYPKEFPKSLGRP